ncbi:MAG: 3-oxoacyl-[acyl-carrier protein] reductase [Candidatus Latescibacterota bacterium]|jgi:3-oxoacyl-[acyl-carrier protein] reductase
MTGRLRDKTALITGAGRGIGAAIAQVFAREGARIAAADIDTTAAQSTIAKLPTEGLALTMDITDRQAIHSGVEQTIAHFGQLDILINNAGYVTFSSFDDCSEEVWDRIIDINLKGTFLCAQAVLPHMKARNTGVIISMSSLAAKTGGVAAGPPYAAAKAGVSALTINLARTMAAYGVRANAISPGVIDTAMTASPAHDPVKAQIPLGHVGQPEDVANCALFLASEEAKHITGEIVDVNGGLFMD